MDLVQRINYELTDAKLTALYGSNADFKAKRQRMADLAAKLPGAQYIFSAPGRTELGGNHTDHNRGRVLAAAVSLDVLAAVRPEDGDTVTVKSEGYPTSVVKLDNLEPVESEQGTTAALIRGIAKAFADRGFAPKAFTAVLTSNIPGGSGLSSSAAVEDLFGTIFNSLCAYGALSAVEIAKIGQYAENSYFGKPCGLMDQCACACGSIIAIDFADPKEPLIKNIPFDFSEAGLDLVITDSRSSHADLTADYAAIPEEMRSVARLMGKEVLSQCTLTELYAALPEIRKALNNDRAVLRAIHFLNETGRAQKMADALSSDDIKTYLNLVKESGKSSFEYLQNVFSPANPGMQAVSLALALSDGFLKDEGAYRVHGGGFAGTIQAYIPKEKTASYIALMEKVFGSGCSTVISIRQEETCRVL